MLVFRGVNRTVIFGLISWEGVAGGIGSGAFLEFDVGLGDGKPRFQPLFFLGKAAVKIKDIR